jgi:hypothetical protein
MQFGISPLNLLLERSKSAMWLRRINKFGIFVILQLASPSPTNREGQVDEELLPSSSVTVSLLCERYKLVRFSNLHSDDARSTEPIKLFPAVLRCIKFGSTSNDRGICPVNSFPCKTMLFKREDTPSNSCIGPESWFCDRPKYSSAASVKRDVGISPAQRREI